MNLIQWLSMIAVGVGGSIFISTLLFGHDFLIEFTGTPIGPLYGGCVIAIILGMIAVVLGLQEQRGPYFPKGGKR
jgi:multisubunit Na+/H+ antiporter MnhB subunit